MDDLIELTVYGWAEDDGERREIVKSENTEYIPRPGTRFPVPEFDEALAGLSVNEKREFTIDVPEDFENNDLAGKKTVFEATVHQIKRKHPPELDDEFAKGVGDGYESLVALRERVTEDLREREQRTLDAVHQDATLAKIVEGARIEMSPLIIDHELEHYVHERQEDFKSGRFTSIEDYQQAIAWQAMSEDEIKEESRPKVEERLKRAHVLRKVAKLQSVEASDEEVDAEIESMVSGVGDQADRMRELFQDQERRDSLRRVLVNRKTLEYLTSISARPGDATGEQEAAESSHAEQEAVQDESDSAASSETNRTRTRARSASGSSSGGNDE
jgi:trigger factor